LESLSLTAIPLAVQVAGGGIIWAVFALQTWQGRKVGAIRWSGFGAWIILVGIAVAYDRPRDWLLPLFPLTWTTLLVGVMPDYAVEKIAGRRDRELLETQYKNADLALMLFLKTMLDNMRAEGKSIEEMEEAIRLMPLKVESREGLLTYQRMAKVAGNAIA